MMKHCLVWVFALALLFCGAVVAEEPNFQIDIKFDKESVRVGEPITATWTVSGAEAPYYLETDWSAWYINSAKGIIRVSCEGVLPYDYTGNTCTFIPQTGESLYFSLILRSNDDKYSRKSSVSIPIIGADSVEDFCCDLVYDKDVVSLGEPLTATLKISGGKPPYTIGTDFNKYVWDMYEKEITSDYEIINPVDHGNGVYTCTCIPTHGDKIRLNTIVMDADGRMIDVPERYVTIQPIRPVEVRIRFEQNEVLAGEPVTAYYTISGGVGPYTLDKESAWMIKMADGQTVYKPIEDTETKYLGQEYKLTFTPQYGEELSLNLIAVASSEESDQYSYDHRLGRASEVVPIKGDSKIEPFKLHVTVDNKKAKNGDVVHADWYATGGVPPYQIDQDNSFWTYGTAPGVGEDHHNMHFFDSGCINTFSVDTDIMADYLSLCVRMKDAEGMVAEVCVNIDIE